MRHLIALAGLLLSTGTNNGGGLSAIPGAAVRSVLVYLLDDVGANDAAELIADGRAPTLAWIAENGVTFSAACSNPTCSPTRYSLLTGLWGTRLGGQPCEPPDGLEPAPELVTIADLCRKAGLRTGLFGKWHLGNNATGGPWELAAQVQGFDVWKGTPANLGLANPCGCEGGYFSWPYVSDGVLTCSTEWAPRVYLEDWKAFWLEDEEPRFAILATNLAHGPMHRPPATELPPGYPPTMTPRENFEAMIAAADRQLAEVLALVDLSTTLVFVLGDNGTPGNVAEPGFALRSKGTTYRRGVHVPCWVIGGPLGKGSVARVVTPADILPTVAQWLEVSPPDGIDGVSMFGTTRPWGISIEFFPSDLGDDYEDIAVVTTTHKLRRLGFEAPFTEQFFNVQNDPDEDHPLSLQGPVQTFLRAILEASIPPEKP